MMPFYTNKQLDYFKTTLKIVQSAIFESDLAEIEAVRLEESAQLKNEQKPVIVDAPINALKSEFNTEVETINRSYFSILSEPIIEIEEFHSALPIEIETPIITVSVQNSASFFKSLPWQTQITPENEINAVVNFIDLKDEVINNDNKTFSEAIENIIDVRLTQASEEFFKSLPWQAQSIINTQTASIVLDNTHEFVNKTIVINDDKLVSDIDTKLVLASSKTSAEFFNSLPWQEKIDDFVAINHLHETKMRVNDVKLIKSTSNKSSAEFFNSLPWQEKIDDFVAINHLHETKMRVNDVKLIKSTSNKSSAEFFKFLPWQESIEADDIMTLLPAHDVITSTPIIKTSAIFFSQLPWQASIKNVFIHDIDNADFINIAALATQTALQAANRSVNTHQVNRDKPKNSRDFFETLPW